MHGYINTRTFRYIHTYIHTYIKQKKPTVTVQTVDIPDARLCDPLFNLESDYGESGSEGMYACMYIYIYVCVMCV